MILTDIRAKQHISQYPNFQGRTPKEVISFYRELDDTFIKLAKSQGVEKPTIIAILEKMIQDSKSLFQSFGNTRKELAIRIKRMIDVLDNTNSIEELKTNLCLPVDTIKVLLSKRQQILRDKEIVRAFNGGETLETIAVKYHIGEKTVLQILRMSGININPLSQKTQKVIEMLKNGATGKEISNELRLHSSIIYGLRRKEQIPLRRVGDISQKYAEVVERLKSGADRRSVANEFKLTKRKVDALAEENGIKETVSDAQKAVSKKLYARKGLAQIAEELDIPVTEALKQAKSVGFTTQKAKELREAAIFEALKTQKAPAVAKEFGVSVNTVYRIKHKFQ